MRPFQESKDVEEKLRDLIPWISKLKDSVTSPGAGDNPEEVERLEQLIRFAPPPRRLTCSSQSYCNRSFEDIEKRSRMLLDKGKVAKILDKKRDSGMIVKLVEQLRQVILVYQVGTV